MLGLHREVRGEMGVEGREDRKRERKRQTETERETVRQRQTNKHRRITD